MLGTRARNGPAGGETVMTGKAEQKSLGTPDETRAFERGTLGPVA